jgi:hypothetical protein
MNLRALCVITAAAALLGGCEEDPEGSFAESCSYAVATEMVGGTWAITGTGTRRSCGTDWLNVEGFRLESQAFVVAQNGNALHLQQAAASAAVQTALSGGKVYGDCVEFRIQETGPFGHVSTHFKGSVVAPGFIAGTFKGTGPESCKTEGEFTLDYECCAGSGPPDPEVDTWTPDIAEPDAADVTDPEDAVEPDVVDPDAVDPDAADADAIDADADAGPTLPDGFVLPADASPLVDVGYLDDEYADAGIFGCEAAPSRAPSAAPWLLLALLVVASRRRVV